MVPLSQALDHGDIVSDSADLLANHIATLLVPIANKYGLTLSAVSFGPPLCAAIDATGGPFNLRLESDRGCASFQLASVQAADAVYWPIDSITSLFPRIRLLASGSQRLSLAEQADFIRSNWSELSLTFGPENYPATHARLMQCSVD